MAGCSLEEEEEGQALSFSQRSLLKVNVTQGRFSQSQCLGTLCLKGEEGRRAKRKKRSVFSGFPIYIYFKGLYNSIRAFQWNGQEKSCNEILGFTPCHPKQPDSKPRGLCEGQIFLRGVFIYVSIPTLNWLFLLWERIRCIPVINLSSSPINHQ